VTAAVCQKYSILPDSFFELTFPQVGLLCEDPEQVQRSWKWSQMTDAAREKVKRLRRDGWQEF